MFGIFKKKGVKRAHLKAFSPAVDAVLKKAATVGQLQKSEDFHITMELPSGVTVRFWAANYPYAYAKDGVVIKDSTILFSWKDSMASPETMESLDARLAALLEDV